jgi:hypothetical protein
LQSLEPAARKLVSNKRLCTLFGDDVFGGVMNNLFKICKHHGQLKQNDILNRKNKRSLECGICAKLRDKKKYEKIFLKTKDFIGPIWIKKKCTRHGDLEVKDIRLDIKSGRLSCKICNNTSRKRTLEKYILNDKTIKTLTCLRHGKLEIDMLYIRKGGWPVCKTCHYEESHLKKYGLNKEKYMEILFSQNNVCKICGLDESTNRPDSKKPRRLSVDHCHETGRIRGILCSSCNIMIGKAKDNPNILIAAANYLKIQGEKI